MVTCNIIIQISLNTLAQAQREKLDVWNWFLRCGNKIQVLSHVFLKKSALYAITPEVTEINNRKYPKKYVVYFQPEDNHETEKPKAKNFKKLQV